MNALTVLAVLHEADAHADATGECLRELLAGTPWRLIRTAQLAAVVADFAAEQRIPSRPNLGAWLEMLSRLGLGRAIVPMRFGQAAEDQREIERFLTCRQEHLRSVLELVGHRVELVVRVISPGAKERSTQPAGEMKADGSGGTPASAGRSFLLNRKQVFFAAEGGDDAETAERVVRRSLGIRAIAIAPEAPTATIQRGGVCVLVSRASATEAIGLIRMGAKNERVIVHITGPLPPLGFSGGVARARTGSNAETAAATFLPEPTLTRPGTMACER